MCLWYCCTRTSVRRHSKQNKRLIALNTDTHFHHRLHAYMDTADTREVIRQVPWHTAAVLLLVVVNGGVVPSRASRSRGSEIYMYQI